jgi:hypothetical protein
MTGANVFMLGILRDNIQELGLNASVAEFDSSIARTDRVLATQTVALSENHRTDGESVAVDIRVENLTGHKLPTGIPLRRMWLYLRATDATGNTVFESGAWDEQGEVAGLDPGYEPHHDVIGDPGQVQIYETIMEDAHGDLTWTLLSAAGYRKDNRLPPLGFTTSAAVYDSVRIEGAALQDGDFNLNNESEGTGADIVHYRFLRPTDETLTVVAMVCYQTLPPRVFAHLDSHDTPEVHLFSGMYAATDKSPVILASLEFTISATSGVDSGVVPSAVRLNQNVPNPFNPTTLISYELDTDREIRVMIHDVQGKLVRTLFAGHQAQGAHAVVWDGTSDLGSGVSSGTYLYTVEAGAERVSRSMVLIR